LLHYLHYYNNHNIFSFICRDLLLLAVVVVMMMIYDDGS